MRLFDMDSREDYLLDGKYKVATPYAPCVDVVEVVRCKECKHRHGFDCPMYDEQWFTIDEGDGYYDSDFRIVDVTEDDGFCDCGERGESHDKRRSNKNIARYANRHKKHEGR